MTSLYTKAVRLRPLPESDGSNLGQTTGNGLIFQLSLPYVPDHFITNQALSKLSTPVPDASTWQLCLALILSKFFPLSTPE